MMMMMMTTTTMSMTIIIIIIIITVSLCLGCSVCVPHTCRCGALVDAHSLHGLTCKQAPSKAVRHNAINKVIVPALSSVGIPTTKELTGLTRVDDKPQAPLSG